jgi:hypothetical protein
MRPPSLAWHTREVLSAANCPDLFVLFGSLEANELGGARIAEPGGNSSLGFVLAAEKFASTGFRIPDSVLCSHLGRIGISA